MKFKLTMAMMYVILITLTIFILFYNYDPVSMKFRWSRPSFKPLPVTAYEPPNLFIPGDLKRANEYGVLDSDYIRVGFNKLLNRLDACHCPKEERMSDSGRMNDAE